MPTNTRNTKANGSVMRILLPFAIYRERIMNTATLFQSGPSQAVRLPEAYRFTGNQVRIRRHGPGVILEPIAADWAWLDAVTGPLDTDFQQAAREQPTMEDRSAINDLFH